MTIELLLVLAVIIVTAGFVGCFYIYHLTTKDLTNKLFSRSPEDYLLLSNDKRNKEPDIQTISQKDDNVVPLRNLSAQEVLDAAVKENQ